MSLVDKNVTFFKTKVTSSLPYRSGPIQCPRNCRNCIITKSCRTQHENLICIKSYDNLVVRRSIWLSKYQAVQYHTGQVEILKQALNAKKSCPHIYLIGSIDHEDVSYLNMILDHVELPIVHQEADCEILELLKTKTTIGLSIYFMDSISDNIDDYWRDHSFHPGLRKLENLLKPLVKTVTSSDDSDIMLVPVAVTKDHNNLMFFGLGSVCVQILEPYSLRDYVTKVQSNRIVGHLVRHLHYDITRNVAVLPTHLIAFILLYVERDEGISFDEIVKYVDWFRKISVELDMQIGFTGESKDVVHFALRILHGHVDVSSGFLYRAKNIESLMYYGNLLFPNVAHYGLIARAILMAYNKHEASQLTIFNRSSRIRVMKDTVVEIFQALAARIETKITFKRPCTTIEATILQTLDRMEKFGNYIRIEEPKMMIHKKKLFEWEEEIDSDDEFLKRNKDNPRLKSWILLTTKEKRIDRLNMFLNAIEPHI